jgi:hypothetical protein
MGCRLAAILVAQGIKLSFDYDLPHDRDRDITKSHVAINCCKGRNRGGEGNSS